MQLLSLTGLARVTAFPAATRDAPRPISSHSLDAYINAQRDEGCRRIDLSKFDLSNTNLSGLDLSLTVLSLANFKAIIANGGTVKGARLLADMDAAGLNIEGVELDHIIAESLIEAGANQRCVLANYLASPHTRTSQLHKARLLQRYIDSERQQNHTPVDLRAFNLHDVMFSNLTFENTLIGRDNLSAMFSGGADLRGARLAAHSAPPLHCLDMVKLDKSIAIQLINAGVDQQSVLANYVATQREQGIVDVDMDRMDLSNVSHRYLTAQLIGKDRTRMVATQPAINASDMAALRDAFQHDMLELLNQFAVFVSDILKQSRTKDDLVRKTTHEDNWPSHAFNIAHHIDVIDIVRSQESGLPVEGAIKFSSGDCGEMAALCKSVLDLYLPVYLQRLGWNALFKAHYVKALPPSRHFVVALECVFAAKNTSYIVDPWSKKAWLFDEGLAHFRENCADGYTHPGTELRLSTLNEVYERDVYANIIKTAFDQFKIKEQLDARIKENKGEFRGGNFRPN